MPRNSFVLSVASALGLALIAQSEPAHACGGLFCSASAPVNQAAERIIFSKNADQTVTAVVQIQYEGPSEEFAWVFPVPGIPAVDVSSDLAFTRLQQASNPQYNFTTVVEGRCKRERGRGDSASGFGPTEDFGSGGAGGSGGVNVLASGTVGPYDFVVIEPDAHRLRHASVRRCIGRGSRRTHDRHARAPVIAPLCHATLYDAVGSGNGPRSVV